MVSFSWWSNYRLIGHYRRRQDSFSTYSYNLAWKSITYFVIGISGLTLYTTFILRATTVHIIERRPDVTLDQVQQTVKIVPYTRPEESLSMKHNFKDDPTQIARTIYMDQYADMVDFDLEGPFNYTALNHKCTDRKIQDGLIFQCLYNFGGLSNVRNMVLTCIRYAIEAGASGLIMPQIEIRDKNHIEQLYTDNFKQFGYLYDEKYFKSRMEVACPSMAIYNKLEEVPYYGRSKVPDVFDPKDLDWSDPDHQNGENPMDRRNYRAQNFRRDFDEYLSHNLTIVPNLEQPVIIRLSHKHLFQWPIHLDGTDFLNSFGRLIRFKGETRAMASVIVSRLLHNTSSLAIAQSVYPTTGYMGIHIRSETDVPKHWPQFEEQAVAALKVAELSKFKYIYLATGQESAFKQLEDMAKPFNITIQSKYSMLTSQEIGWLEEFSFDQMAEVDYLVLLLSEKFVGSGYSSFSAQLAVRRHIFIDSSDTHPFSSANSEDEISKLIKGPFPYIDMVWP